MWTILEFFLNMFLLAIVALLASAVLIIGYVYSHARLYGRRVVDFVVNIRFDLSNIKIGK